MTIAALGTASRVLYRAVWTRKAHQIPGLHDERQATGVSYPLGTMGVALPLTEPRLKKRQHALGCEQPLEWALCDNPSGQRLEMIGEVRRGWGWMPSPAAVLVVYVTRTIKV